MQKGILTINNAIWNAKRRYKVNSVVKFVDAVYQNSTGRNSSPDLLIDWVILKDNVSVNTRIKDFTEIYIDGAQEFTLPTYAQIIQVSVNGWSTKNYTKPNDTTVVINTPIGSGQQVVILYLVDENTNITPYYSQAQVDSLIAGVSAGGVVTGNYTPTLTMFQNISSGTVRGASFSKSNDLVTLNLYFEVVLASSGSVILKATVPTIYPIADIPENLTIGSGTMANNGYHSILVQRASSTTLNINFKADISGVFNAIIYTTVTYKTQ